MRIHIQIPFYNIIHYTNENHSFHTENELHGTLPRPFYMPSLITIAWYLRIEVGVVLSLVLLPDPQTVCYERSGDLERNSNLHSAVTQPIYRTFFISKINCGKRVWKPGSILILFWSTCRMSLFTLNHTYYKIFIHMCKLVQIVITVGVTLYQHYF